MHDVDGTDSPVCPYCGYEHDPEPGDYEGDMECEDCGESFYCETDVQVTFSTRCLEHKFDDNWKTTERSRIKYRECVRCGKMELADEDR